MAQYSESVDVPFKTTKRSHDPQATRRHLILVLVLIGLASSTFLWDYITFEQESGQVAWMDALRWGGSVADWITCSALAYAVIHELPSWLSKNKSEKSAKIDESSRKARFDRTQTRAKSPQQFSETTGNQSAKDSNQRAVVAQFNHELDLVAKSGEAQQAAMMLLDFERRGGKPESVTYNLVIRAFAKKGDMTSASKWLSRMETKGIQATLCSYNTMLDACAKANDAKACE